MVITKEKKVNKLFQTIEKLMTHSSFMTFTNIGKSFEEFISY